jgi:hypothetical protein
MTDDEWEREYQIQTDYLAMQLRALMTRPIKTRKSYIFHQIRCAGCGDVLVQVVDLVPYRVIRYRGSTSDEQLLPADMDPRERALAMAARKRSIRLDKNWMFFPVGEHDADERPHLVQAMCRCTQGHQFTLRAILDRGRGQSTARPTHSN